MQGRAGEELGAELTKSLERYLKPGSSGRGKHLNNIALPRDREPAGNDLFLSYTVEQVMQYVLSKQLVQCRIGGSLDLRALSIVSGRRCWILCIDALILAVDGNVLDALSIAVKVLLSYFPHTFGSVPFAAQL